MARPHCRCAPGATVELLGSDNIDTREYHGHAGDLIRIDVYAAQNVDQVRVTIHAEKAGLLEQGLARFDPAARQWLYTATAPTRDSEDWTITATALRRRRMRLRRPRTSTFCGRPLRGKRA
jgi:hypothetical protein